MARSESDREDLMQEATALVERVEFRAPHEDEPIVAGFHRDGRLSVYFGGDPVYHFDTQSRLRRAFVNGDLYRTQGNTLARLTRQRTANSSVLHRVDLETADLAAFLDQVTCQLRKLLSCEATELRVEQSVPDSNVFDRALAALRKATDQTIQLAPAIRGKR